MKYRAFINIEKLGSTRARKSYRNVTHFIVLLFYQAKNGLYRIDLQQLTGKTIIVLYCFTLFYIVLTPGLASFVKVFIFFAQSCNETGGSFAYNSCNYLVIIVFGIKNFYLYLRS